MKLLNKGGNRVTIGLQNMTLEKITLKKGTKVTRVVAANIVPPMLAPDLSIDKSELKYMMREHNQEGVPTYKAMNLGENVVKPEPTPEIRQIVY